MAIVIYENVQPLDWTGPYEVYNDAGRFGAANNENAFNVYTVSKTMEPVNGQGLKLLPNYSIENAPRPDIVVFPGGPAAKVHGDPVFFAWAEKVAKEAEIAQSVCTGAFVLAKAGLLDGLEVTTFHGAIDSLQQEYPKTSVKRGRRFVDNGRVVTTAGISAGIDGSLHVVARLLGRRVADQTAKYMEYAWSPEASLAGGYSYFNPSTDDLGREAQAAGMHLQEKRYAEAEKAFRAILARSPDSEDTWQGLGYALQGQKQHAGAADALVRAVGAGADPHAGVGVVRGRGAIRARRPQGRRVRDPRQVVRARLRGPGRHREEPRPGVAAGRRPRREAGRRAAVARVRVAAGTYERWPGHRERWPGPSIVKKIRFKTKDAARCARRPVRRSSPAPSNARPRAAV